jgi:aliphatic nitrilase
LVEEDAAFLQDPANLGGTSIIDPYSRVIAGPMGAEEGVLYADVDLEATVRAKLFHDFAGHYNRPDVFQVRLNAQAPQILRRESASGREVGPDPVSRDVGDQDQGLKTASEISGSDAEERAD